MNWKITYYDLDVQQEILNLPKTLLARYLRMTDLMLKFGAHLGEPHTKAMGNGLLELRLKRPRRNSESFLLYYCWKRNCYAPLHYQKAAENSFKGFKNSTIKIDGDKK